jgi:hypothetical protein
MVVAAKETSGWIQKARVESIRDQGHVLGRRRSGSLAIRVEIRPLMALVVKQSRCSHLPHSPRMAHELPGFVLMRARRVAYERLSPTRACLFADARPLRARLL